MIFWKSNFQIIQLSILSSLEFLGPKFHFPIFIFIYLISIIFVIIIIIILFIYSFIIKFHL